MATETRIPVLNAQNLTGRLSEIKARNGDPPWGEVIAEGDRVALVFRIVATHRGEFLGLPETGKRVEFGGTFLLRIADGEIQHERRVYDFSGLLIKLGVLKVKPV